MNIYEKIMKIRVDVSVIDIKKSGYNKYSKFAYFELKDFLTIATKMFKDTKLYTKFSIIPATTELEETAKFTIVNSENPEEIEIYTLPTAECYIGKKADGTGGADPIQNLGGKITYLRRYMYFIALDLIEDDSVDNREQNNGNGTSNSYKTDEEAIAAETAKGLAKIMGSLNKKENVEFKPVVLKAMCEELKVDKWSDIKFTKDLTYKSLTEKVIAKLQSEKDLANAGI